MSSKNISFSDKKISKNALFSFVLGVLLVVGFLVLIGIAFFTQGGLGRIGGLMGCVFMVLALFGVLWGVASYDEARTSNSFKISGICLNIVVIFMGITFIMM